MNLSVRSLVVGALTAIAGLAATALPASDPANADSVAPPVPSSVAPATADSPGYDLPRFRSTGEIVDPLDDTLPWNPTHEFIFPSLFHAGEYLEQPLGEWYIYYGPHDPPGGINLMYADDLDGPWTQYQGNPVISNDWAPHYNVSHVASPDAVWNPADDQMYLFFHGENTTNRVATSADGIHFEYGSAIVSTADVDAAQPGRDAFALGYARVFPHPDPDSGYAWAMFFMTNYADDHRRINLAESTDLTTWDIADAPIVEPGDAEGGNVAAADLFAYRGQNYIVYHGSTGTILARSIAADLRTTGEAQPLFIPDPAPPANGRAASAQFAEEDGVLHMFYEYGDRSHTTVGHAIEDPTAPLDPANTHPDDPVWDACSGAGSDEFDGTALDTALWSSSVRMGDSRHVVADGVLSMPTYVGNSTNAPIILQPIPQGDSWEVTTKLAIDPQVNFQQAGLIARRDDANSVRVDLAHTRDGVRIDFVYRSKGVDRLASLTDYELAPSDLGDTIWLRMTRAGDWIMAAYSVDGITFRTAGRAAPAVALAATDIGPFAYRGTASTPEIEAAFDWIRFAPSAEELDACTADTTGPEISVKEGVEFTVGAAGTYSRVSFKLHDVDGMVDRLALNGVVKDLTDDAWSDLNGVTPGIFGAIEGENTLVVFDTAGNPTSVTFILDTTAPAVTVKSGEQFTDVVNAKKDRYRMVSFKLFDGGEIDRLTVNGVAKDLTDNAWSDLNHVRIGSFGAVKGTNVLVVYDVAGNSTAYSFTLRK
jgi:regulation of enolase protein 1 (concanavalin A-like superfamily)